MGNATSQNAKSGQFTKGHKRGGRPKGSKSQITQDVRQVIKLIAERRAPQVESWLVRVAKKRPDKAVDLYLRMIEYHIPKLVRSELTGPNGTDLPLPVVHVHFPGVTDQRQEKVVAEVPPPAITVKPAGAKR